MQLRNVLTTLVIVGFCGIVLAGCPNSTTSPTTSQAVERKNLRPDSTVGWLYYALEGDSMVPSNQASTDTWDIRMAYLLCCGQTKQIDVFLNSGSAGIGSTKGAMVSSRFENLTAVPAGVTLVADDTSAANRIVPVSVIGGDVMFVYDLSTHTINPSPDKCLVISTRKGNTFKFQFTSIYQDAPSSPTVLTPLGYYHFRYQKL